MAKRISSLACIAFSPLSAPKEERIDRSALRPGPRQLTSFHLLSWVNNALDVEDVAGRAGRLFANLGFSTAPVGDNQKYVIVATGPSAYDCLNHSIATIDQTEIHVGIESVLIAICAFQPRWPLALGKILECYFTAPPTEGALVELQLIAQTADVPLLIRYGSPNKLMRETCMSEFLIVTREREFILSRQKSTRKVYATAEEAVYAFNS